MSVNLLDIFKDGAEAWFQRVKSPLLGSVFLAFLACNWKAIFFVLFSETPILLRFWYFDQQTSIHSLLSVPVAVGLVIGVAIPFLNYFGSWCARRPTERLRVLQTRSASAVLKEKSELAISRELASAEYKEAILRGAEASEKLRDADLSPETRANVESKVGEIDDVQKRAGRILSEDILDQHVKILRGQAEHYGKMGENAKAAQRLEEADSLIKQQKTW